MNRTGIRYIIWPKDLRRAAFCMLANVCCLLTVFCFEQSPVAAQRVVDKMVATINAGARTDLITYSDLLWQLALEPNTPLDNPTSAPGVVTLTIFALRAHTNPRHPLLHPPRYSPGKR